MFEHDHEELEHIVISPYEHGARGSRPIRYKTTGQQRQEAKLGQLKSGMRLRIWRKVYTENAFEAQLPAWELAEQEKTYRDGKEVKTAIRRELGNFSLTVFDTKQTPLKNPPEDTEDDLRERLKWRFPELFEDVGPVKVQGIELFGGKHTPFIALQFARRRGHEPNILDTQQTDVCHAVANELRISDAHHRVHRPHVSLGKIQVENPTRRREIADRIMDDIRPVMPREVVCGPLQLRITPLVEDDRRYYAS